MSLESRILSLQARDHAQPESPTARTMPPGRFLVLKKKNIETRARSAQMWRIYGAAASLIGSLGITKRLFLAW